MKNFETTKEEKMLMIQCEQGYPDSERVQELLLKLDSIHFVDVASVAHGAESTTGMAQYVNKSVTSSGNYVKHDKEGSSNFIAHDMGQSGLDDSTLQIPDGMPGISEVHAQYAGEDDEPAQD